MANFQLLLGLLLATEDFPSALTLPHKKGYREGKTKQDNTHAHIHTKYDFIINNPVQPHEGDLDSFDNRHDSFT